jgi:hypothetical protein
MLNVGVERLKGKRGSVCMICKSVCVRKWKKTGGGEGGRRGGRLERVLRHARTARPSCAHCLNRIKKRKQRNAKYLQQKRALAAYYSVAHFVLFCFAVSNTCSVDLRSSFFGTRCYRTPSKSVAGSLSAMHAGLCLKCAYSLTPPVQTLRS